MTTVRVGPAVGPAVGLTAGLASYGARPALVGAGVPGGALSYADLAGRVDDVAARLGPVRRLVLVEGGNSVDTLVAYLGALAGRHPVLLADRAGLDAATGAYDPDVVVRRGSLDVRRPGTAHDLHPDLALLLSTSGSTGSPKLVRLSHQNLVANATSIAAYLDLRPDDVAATTLPLHYCYGLSVVNSHLRVGAALLLTEDSVLEPAFWTAFRDHGATSFAGVPHTFELLDRVGFADLHLPSLRYVTQAGGRLAPEDVSRYAELGQRRGFDFFVMYGQTEATARMAYLPPDLAHRAPSAIGVPVPGGSFTLDPVEPGEPGVGELVYSGPNVMLGYAESAADLSLGRTVDRLRTGDLARLRSDGCYEIVGRRSRIAKVFGLRLDLDRVERVLLGRGLVVCAADGGDRLVLAVGAGARPVDPAVVATAVREEFGLPVAGHVLLVVTEVPRLASGKPDYPALQRAAAAGPAGPARTVGPGSGPTSAQDVVALYAALLGRPDARATDSFVSLGGDSLSYVEVSLRLEGMLGHLPPGWHTTPVADLVGPPGVRRRGIALESNVVLRAFAIVSIVGTHANLLGLLGGAHLLLGIVGYNFARFQVTDAPVAARLGSMLASIARIAVPSALVIAGVSVFVDGLGWRQILLVNGLTTGVWTEPGWHYWFIEALVHTLLLMTLLLAIPAVARLERRQPFAFPYALAVAGLLTRYGVVGLGGTDEIHRAHVIFWLFAVGWAAAKASSAAHRVLLTLLVVASVPGFFQGFERNAYVLVGMLVLFWLPLVRVPRLLGLVASVLASASLWIYLVHWQVYPYLENRIPWLATLLSLAAGVVAWRLWAGVTRLPGALRSRAGNELRAPAGCSGGVRTTKGAARATCGDDQPAHVPTGPAGHR